ncbi:transcriptional repressor [Tissierella sp. Yu-01]|uniref:Fur family transcriptional regulator n=1 Tax=Tissierella sp. Yu-01 TaxID=3035694 RepID=UPI00240D83CD|nr:transcriptional repressor [Tissierella sp. Yu-01]WFA08931.1 transcriptional repressor [Tissierella sp. Yu-01]
MNNATQYKTKQKEAIRTYMQSLQGEHVTVNQIANHFDTIGQRIGITTIYRYLDKLVEEKKVKKYMIDGVTGACFQYVDEREHPQEHFHFKCEGCGELIHFQCESLKHAQVHLLKDHGFNIDTAKVIFYGICNQCSNR